MKRKNNSLFSRKILISCTTLCIIIVLLLIYKNSNATREVIELNQSPSPSVSVSSPPLYTTPINRPAEECSVTSFSKTRDTYSCTHFTLQLPKGWYGSYMIGQDKTLSYSEFYNYDYTNETLSHANLTDPKKQKLYLILYLSNKSVNEYVAEDEIATKREYKDATFSTSPISRSDYNGLKVNSTGSRSSQNTSYVLQNPSKTIILTFGGIFGVDDILLEEIFSTIKFTESGN